jgi:hypothetical protein
MRRSSSITRKDFSPPRRGDAEKSIPFAGLPQRLGVEMSIDGLRMLWVRHISVRFVLRDFLVGVPNLIRQAVTHPVLHIVRQLNGG